MADDNLSAALVPIRERQAKATAREGDAALWIGAMGRLADEDVPRLLAVVDAVLAAHRNADGRCAWCRNADGQRQKWPCGEYLDIARELTGEAGRVPPE